MQWLKKQTASGYTRPQLEGLLRQQGNSEEDINQAFQQAGPSQSADKGKNSSVAIILVFLFLGLSIVAGIFAYNQYQENDELLKTVDAVKREVTDKEDEMNFKIEKLDAEISSSKVRYDTMVESKDQTIRELNLTIKDLQLQLGDQGQQVTIPQEDVTAGSTLEGLFEETPEETQPPEVEEETVTPIVVADENTPLVFPNSTVDFNLENPLVLTTAIYNEENDWVMFQGRLYCINDNQEEFELAEVECEWVAPFMSQAFTLFIPAYATTWKGVRACYVEFWETDETCEQKLGKLMQEPFEMDIY